MGGNGRPDILVKALGGFAWEPEDAELTKETLDEAHRLGLKVVVWSWPEKLGTTFDAGMVDRLIGWGIEHVTHAGVVRGLGLWLLPGSIVWLLWKPSAPVTR